MSDITIKFRGEDYTIPEHRAFEAADAIETWYSNRFPGKSALFDLMNQGQSPNYTVIANCIALLLRVAGAKAQADEVWRDMMARIREGEPVVHMSTVTSLIAVLMDGAPEKKSGGDQEKTDAS